MDILSQWGSSTIHLHEKECEMCAKIARKKLILDHFLEQMYIWQVK